MIYKLLDKLIIFILKSGGKLAMNGLKKIWEMKFNKNLYIGLGITTTIMIVLQIVTSARFGMLMTIAPFIIYYMILGNIKISEDKKLEKEILHYNRLFDICDIKHKDKSYPAILEKNEEYMLIWTYIPLSKFETYKDKLESAFNVDIASFEQLSNKQLIKINFVNDDIKESSNCFEAIGFKDKLGNYPNLLKNERAGDKETLVFKSNIALSDWINRKEDIETVLNTNIIDIKQYEDKQIVHLETTKKNIPNYIKWDNNLLLDELNINLGKTALNQVTINLESYTSGIISGSVGSGKSVSLMCLVYQLLLKRQYKNIPVEINLFDGKGGLDWYYFEDYINTFDTSIDNFADTIDKIIAEYERRKLLFAKKAQKLSIWNSKYPDKKLPDIFIVIDEISIITDCHGMENEDKVIRKSITRKLSDLARLGRAMGIHIIIGIQVPNMQTVPGQLKNVLDMRISGFLKDESASNIILQNNLASKLKHIKGRMILDTLEYQSYFIDVESTKIFKTIDKLDNTEIDTTKTIELSKKRKKTTKKDSNSNIEADIDLTNE